MDRAAKAELVTALHDVFKDAGVVVVSHYAGMTVAQMTDYRRKIKAAGGSVRVAKNRLAKIAAKDTDSASIVDLFKGQTVLAYSKDPIAAARIAVQYAKTNDKLVILGGTMGTTVLSGECESSRRTAFAGRAASQAYRPTECASDQDRSHSHGAGSSTCTRDPGESSSRVTTIKRGARSLTHTDKHTFKP